MGASNPLDEQSAQTQLALLSQRMAHVVEVIEDVKRGQLALIEMSTTVMVHDKQLGDISNRMVGIEERYHKAAETTADKLQDISKQIIEGMQYVSNTTNQSITRAHERMDEFEGQMSAAMSDSSSKLATATSGISDRVSGIEKTVASASGGVKVMGSVLGIIVLLGSAATSWVFSSVSTSHDAYIQMAERVKVLEQVVYAQHQK